MASSYALESFTNLFDTYPILKQEIDAPFSLMSSYQQFIAITQYARFINELNRRETWQETVFRYLDYIMYQSSNFDYNISQEDMYDIYTGIVNLDVFPSMRLLRSAGDSVKKNACSSYNCSYLPIKDFKSFTELMYLSMSGCGVGFSVESKNIQSLPVIPILSPCLHIIKVEDSRESWVLSFETLLDTLALGFIPQWDMSSIRPKGMRLRTAGGYSSGKDPLDKLFHFTVNTFKKSQGRKLNSLECHDLCCMIGEIAVAGSIRRAATISYSDLSDIRMRDCKSGEWWKDYPYRSLANNSAVYVDTVSECNFLDEWQALQDSGSGERGIFGEVATHNKVKSLKRRDPDYPYRSNPCFSEQTIVLTKQGHFPIKDLVGKKVDIWNGQAWQTIDNFRVTGENQPMLKITLHDNSEIRVTPYHSMILEDDTRIEARNLEPGMVLKQAHAPEVHGSIKINSYMFIVKSINPDGIDSKVYCCTVHGSHSLTLFNDILVAQCNEILLRPFELCNLSNVVIRPIDTLDSLKKKVRLATILGTIQSTITHFDENLLRPEWKKNCDEERLLGVSLTGIANHPFLFSSSSEVGDILTTLRENAVLVNKDWAERLHINQSAAVTCTKPSGDSSELANCSSGIHPCFSTYYIRRVRLSKSDPISQWMLDQGISVEEDIYTPNTYVFSFPINSPGGVYQKDISAVEHAEVWKRYKNDFTEHTVSCTISVGKEEWEPLGKWVYKNIQEISGLSFLPTTEHTYKQTPFESITQDEYSKMKNESPKINWKEFTELEDLTSESPLFACVGDRCTI